jgi:assimilatory nitrate reductase catalytic subunit
MASTVAGHKPRLRRRRVPGCYEDLEQADVMVLVGSNARLVPSGAVPAHRGGAAARPAIALVVIDPRRTATSDSADLHLPLARRRRALFNGLLRISTSAAAPIAWDGFAAHVGDGFARPCKPRPGLRSRRHVARDGLRPARSRRGAFLPLFARHRKNVTVSSARASTSPRAGVDKVNAIINCHLATAASASPAWAVLRHRPAQRHGRARGRRAGQHARRAYGFEPTPTSTASRGSGTRRTWPKSRASRPSTCSRPSHRGPRQGGVDHGHQPGVSLPDADRVRRPARLRVSSSCRRLRQHRHARGCAHVLLPAAAWGEKDGTVTNSERRLSRQRTFLPRRRCLRLRRSGRHLSRTRCAVGLRKRR